VLWLRDDGTGSGGLSAGLAGVALTQALQLVGMFQVRLLDRLERSCGFLFREYEKMRLVLQYAVRQAAETENLMTAVERVRAFTLVRREVSTLSCTSPGWKL
jgi:hypothetical protein